MNMSSAVNPLEGTAHLLDELDSTCLRFSSTYVPIEIFVFYQSGCFSMKKNLWCCFEMAGR